MSAEETFPAARHQKGGFLCDQQKTRGIIMLPHIFKSEVFKIVIICKECCKNIISMSSRQALTEE